MYRIIAFSVALLIALLSLVTAVIFGSENISLVDAVVSLFTKSNNNAHIHQIVWEIRAPRAAAAFACGALLALSGALLQVLLRNPLADPYIFGISGGAAVGVLLAILLGMSWIVTNISAMAGALLVTGVVFGLTFSSKNWHHYRALILGVVIAAAMGAVVTLILTQAADTQIQGMLFWIVGDLSAAPSSLIAWMILFIVVAFSLLQADGLNALLLGEEQAKTLGVSILVLQASIFISAALATTAAVIVGGTIGFVGLIIPHSLRLIRITNHHALLPLCALVGGSFLTFADTAARTVAAPMQLPVGAITALIGVPVLIVLLFMYRR